MLTAVLDCLEHVVIQLTGEENAYQVFQTLNATGTQLTQVDLLRNAFFVLAPNSGDELHTSLWRPMEDDLGESGLQDFFLTDLIRTGHNIPSKDIFAKQDRILRRDGHDEAAVGQLLEGLRADHSCIAFCTIPHSTRVSMRSG